MKLRTSKEPPITPRWAKISQLIVYSGYSRATLLDLIHSGELKVMRKSRGKTSPWMVDLNSWDRFAQDHSDLNA